MRMMIYMFKLRQMKHVVDTKRRVMAYVMKLAA